MTQADTTQMTSLCASRIAGPRRHEANPSFSWGRLLCGLLLGLCLASAAWGEAVQPEGSGTAAAPYEIASLENLIWVQGANLSGTRHFVQTADIDLISIENWNPIGGSSERNIVYNGDGYVIRNLTIDRPNSTYQGLFGNLGSSSKIENVRLENVNIRGDRWVGGVAGRTAGRIEDTSVTGSVRASREYVGGIVGQGSSASLDNRLVFIGEVVGAITSTQSSTSVGIGGIVGRASGSTSVSVAYVRGSVKGNYAGGAVGSSSTANSTFSQIYTAVEVLTHEGQNLGGAVIGRVESSGDVVNNSVYWDESLFESAEGLSVPGATKNWIGLSTEQMQGESAITNMSNLDFDFASAEAPWRAVSIPLDDYPVFEWQVGETIALSGTVTGPDDAPVEGVTVTAQSADANLGSVTTTTDAAGKYRFEVFQAATARVFARALDGDFPIGASAEGPFNNNDVVDLKMAPQALVVGNETNSGWVQDGNDILAVGDDAHLNLNTLRDQLLARDITLVAGGSIGLAESAEPQLSAANALGFRTGGAVRFANATALTLGAIDAAGEIEIKTDEGDITLQGDVTTEDDSAQAIVLAAGFESAAGDTAGGSVIVSESVSVTVGEGGIARLYGGVNSAELIELVDESRINVAFDTVFDPALTAGVYALSRSPFAEGEGTKQRPFKVSGVAEFALIRNNPAAFYAVEGNIALPEGETWTPIGSDEQPFTGGLSGVDDEQVVIEGLTGQPLFDVIGPGAEISSMTVRGNTRDEAEGPAGLFANAIFGEAENPVVLENITVDGDSAISGTDADGASKNRIGGIAGVINGAVMTDISVDATVSGSGHETGGVAGLISDSTLNTVSVAGTVTGAGDKTGGVAGVFSGGSITKATVAATVTGGGENTGGIAGAMSDADVEESLVSGAVTGAGDNTGGVAGSIESGSVTGSTVTAAVSGGGDGTGGVAGSLFDAQVSATTVAGNVTGGGQFTGGIGGIIAGSSLEGVQVTGEVTGADEATTGQLGGSVSEDSNVPTPPAVTQRFDIPEVGEVLARIEVTGESWAFSEAAGASAAIPVTGAANSPASPPPAGLEFPYGLLAFSLILGDEGSDAEVSFTYPEEIDPNAQYWKYNPTQDQWFALPADRVSIAGDTVTIRLTDGGVGDVSGQADGQIVDPGGVAIQAQPAVPVPVNSAWVMWLLVLMVLTAGVIRLAGREQRSVH